MQKAKTILSILNQKSKRFPNYKFKRLYRVLYSKDFYRKVYSKIVSRESNLIKSIDKDTKNGFLEKKIDQLVEEIKTERYHPKPIGRKYIKNKSKKLSSLSNPSFSDKLIQEIVKEIIEVIYEPHFSQNSHGYRLNKNCHTALFQIEKNWRGCNWLIKGDITGLFNNVHHSKLMEILSEKIDDNRFIRLVNKFLKAGYMEKEKRFETYSGNPPGVIISSILVNIYLNEFDKFMEKVCEQNFFGELEKRNPEYIKLNLKYHYYLNKWQFEKASEFKRKRDKLRDLYQKDKGYSRVKYCRYAYDFVIGIWDDKSTAKKIKNLARNFLKNKLLIELNQDKIFITNLKDNNVKFLGYELSKSRKNKCTANNKTSFFENKEIQLLIPTEVVNKHIKKYTRNGKAVHLPQRMNQSDFDILSQYNAEIRSLCYYYSLAADVSTKINKIRHYHYDSLVKTLAFKHKCSYKKIIEKYGVEVPLKNNKTGVRKILGINYRTEDGEKVLIYFNESVYKRKMPIINLEDQVPLKRHY